MAHKIAIVEDDPAIAKMYELKFQADGYEVKVAINGVEGLELLEAFKPEVVLLDLMMPQMGGDEMLVKLRAQPWGKSIKVFILTNIGEQEIPENLKKLDVSDVILKAYHTPTQVVEKVKQATG